MLGHWSKLINSYQAVEALAQDLHQLYWKCSERAPNKFRTLINNILDYIKDCPDYEAVIEMLTQLFVKQPNEILLGTNLPRGDNSLVKHWVYFLENPTSSVKIVSSEKIATLKLSVQRKRRVNTGTFINGLASSLIHQCLLENKQLDLQTAFDQANALDLAQKNSEAYMTPCHPSSNCNGFFPRWRT